ncbi:MAG: hypothetical protein M0Z66_16600 [Thermaerobacter sp.]|nr:hypothetical protein [Thermaerobacter sp.]
MHCVLARSDTVYVSEGKSPICLDAFRVLAKDLASGGELGPPIRAGKKLRAKVGIERGDLLAHV